MKRRELLKSAAAISAMAAGCAPIRRTAEPFRRVRPDDPAWPSQASWETLSRDVGGRLIKLERPPFDASQSRNPYQLGDQPALTQTWGWLDAWTPAPSAYAVAAAQRGRRGGSSELRRETNLRLVVKGGGHSYLGTSNAPDSLLIWTRAMNKVTLHDAFVAQGCEAARSPVPAVTAEAGAMWIDLYHAVTTEAGRYVQGGGCTTVGVAGLVQSGGFGSFSKGFGTAAAGLLEAEVVTADGKVRIANACTNPDLFWALKGGGGGSFGVITKLTLRTHELPEFFGFVGGEIKAQSDAAFRELINRFIGFYSDNLFNPHWGEQIRFQRRNVVNIVMVFQGLTGQAAEEVWRPFRDWVGRAPGDFTWEAPLQIAALPARHLWDAAFLRQHAPRLIVADDRPRASERDFIWVGDRGEAGQILHGYRLPVAPRIAP